MCLPFDMSACDDHCSNVIHCNLIDEYCQDIIACIHAAANQTVVKIPCNSLKPYWNDELDRLKEAAIAWHNIWTSAGKPQSGQLFHIKCSTQLKYKLAIRDSYVKFENKHVMMRYTSISLTKSHMPFGNCGMPNLGVTLTRILLLKDARQIKT